MVQMREFQNLRSGLLSVASNRWKIHIFSATTPRSVISYNEIEYMVKRDGEYAYTQRFTT